MRCILDLSNGGARAQLLLHLRVEHCLKFVLYCVRPRNQLTASQHEGSLALCQAWAPRGPFPLTRWSARPAASLAMAVLRSKWQGSEPVELVAASAAGSATPPPLQRRAPGRSSLPGERPQPRQRQRCRVPPSLLLGWLAVALFVHVHLLWSGKTGFSKYPPHPIAWPPRQLLRRADLHPLVVLNSSADSCAQAG